MDERTLFRGSPQSLDLSLNPQSPNNAYWRSFGLLQIQPFFNLWLLVLEKKINSIEFCTKGFMKLNLLPKKLSFSIFLHQKVKKNKKRTKGPSFRTPLGVCTCLLDLSPRTTPVGVLLEYFSFSHFFTSSCCFQKK